MKESKHRTFTIFVLSFVLTSVVAIMLSCGGNSNPTSATNGTVNLSMTDPGVCSFQFSHIYVTVTKVMANINAGAGPGGNGWQTLVDLTKSPMHPVQIDLLSLNPTNTCLLKQLESGASLPAGKYQQIRLYLLSNTASGSGTPSSNSCLNNSGWNCVVTGTDPNAVYTELQLPSEAQTGIKIPSPNIMSGGFTVSAGQSVDLNLDFQSCESIVQAGGSGGYLLKPVLFAGEVSPNTNSISGQVVVGDANGQPVLTNDQPTAVPNAIVLFEMPTSNPETVMESETTDQNGNFFACPLAGSNYDVVATAQNAGTLGTTTYNPTVAFGVPLGTNLGQVPLAPETPSAASTGGAATIAGQVDTSSSPEKVTLAPTMSLTPTGGSATDVVIPVFSVNGVAAMADPPSVMTASSASCTVSGADCNDFSLTVPASNATTGTFNNGSIMFQGPDTTGNILYKVTASSDKCTGGAVSEPTPSSGVTADSTTTLSLSLSLTGCN